MRLKRAAFLALIMVLLVPAMTSAGVYDAYKLTLNERNWHINYDGLVDALSNAALPLTVPEIDYIGNYGDDLNNARTAIGSARKLLLVNRATAVSTTMAVPETLQLWVTREGQFNIANGVTLTINSFFAPGNYQVFNCSGTGKVVGIPEGYFEWFGAVGDGTTDDTAAVTLALLSNMHVKTVPGKTYKLTSAITCYALSNLTLELVEGSTIKQTAADTAALIFTGCDNIRITGTGTISGPGGVAGLMYGSNPGVQAKTGTKNFRIDNGVKITGFQSYGLAIGWAGINSVADLCQNPIVDGAHIFGNRGGGIWFDAGYNGKITNCSLYRNGGFTSPAGTISQATDSTTITGVGTSFSSSFIAGDLIRLDGLDMIRYIVTVTDDTHLTIAFPFTCSFSGESYSKVSTDGGGAGIVADSAASAIVLIQNNHIYGNSRKGVDSHVSQHLSILGNQIHDNSTYGVELYPNTTPVLQNAKINDNTIYHNGMAGVRVGSGADPLTNNRLRIQINNNTLWQNFGDITVHIGKHVDVSHNICIAAYGDSIVCPANNPSNITMIGNTVLDMAGIGISILGTTDNTRLIGNSVMWTSDSPFAQGGTTGYSIADTVTNLVWEKNTASGCNVNFVIPTNLGDAYDNTVGIQRIHNNIDKIFSPVQTVADNAVIDLPNARGFLFVHYNSYPAIYGITSTLNITYEMSDPGNKFSITKDNAGTINIYYDSGYKLQNKTGGSATIGMTMIHTAGQGD